MTTDVGRVVGLRFRDAGKIFYFDAGDLQMEPGEYVVAETGRGIEMGRVVIAPGDMLGSDGRQEFRAVLRLATGDDRDSHEYWKGRSHDALELARLKSGELKLGFLIASAEFNLDGSNLTLYYESEEQRDYRSLVRAILTELDVEIQMERIGPRDRAKLADGYDLCGQRLCCTTWLTTFPSVSIKMAKEQNLALNPAKISGVCGRLYCCLTYEYEVYRDLRGTLPKQNARVSTPTGEAKVINVNPLKGTVVLLMEDGKRIEATGDQIQYGKLVRPIEVELGEPTYDDETRQAKTALVPVRTDRRGESRRPERPDDRGRGPQRPPLQGAGRPRPEGVQAPPPGGEGGEGPRRQRARRGPIGQAPPTTAVGPEVGIPRPAQPARPPQGQQPGPAGEGDEARRRRRRRRRGGGGAPRPEGAE